MEWSIETLYRWEDLAGAFLGPFLAVLLSGIGFLIARKMEQAQERKETLRRIEAVTSYMLNNVYGTREKLNFFVQNLRKEAADTRQIADPRAFVMNFVNIPAMAGIYLDADIPH